MKKLSAWLLLLCIVSLRGMNPETIQESKQEKAKKIFGEIQTACNSYFKRVVTSNKWNAKEMAKEARLIYNLSAQAYSLWPDSYYGFHCKYHMCYMDVCKNDFFNQHFDTTKCASAFKDLSKCPTSWAMQKLNLEKMVDHVFKEMSAGDYTGISQEKIKKEILEFYHLGRLINLHKRIEDFKTVCPANYGELWQSNKPPIPLEYLLEKCTALIDEVIVLDNSRLLMATMALKDNYSEKKFNIQMRLMFLTFCTDYFYHLMIHLSQIGSPLNSKVAPDIVKDISAHIKIQRFFNEQSFKMINANYTGGLSKGTLLCAANSNIFTSLIKNFKYAQEILEIILEKEVLNPKERQNVMYSLGYINLIGGHGNPKGYLPLARDFFLKAAQGDDTECKAEACLRLGQILIRELDERADSSICYKLADAYLEKTSLLETSNSKNYFRALLERGYIHRAGGHGITKNLELALSFLIPVATQDNYSYTKFEALHNMADIYMSQSTLDSLDKATQCYTLIAYQDQFKSLKKYASQALLTMGTMRQYAALPDIEKIDE